MDARPRTPAYADHPHYEMEAWAEEFARASVGAADAPAGMDVALRVGAPNEEIVRYAQEEDCDLIVLAWGGHLSPTRARVVGALLRTAVCPLLFFRAGETATR